MRRFSIGALVTVCAATAMLLAGCAGESSTGAVPESARLAPADALAFATVTTDAGSAQWQQAEDLLERVPGARDGFSFLGTSLADEGQSWEEDVAPALGPEVVIVVTADRRPVVLVQPEDVAKLEALIAKSTEPVVRRPFGDWTALAEREADLDAYGAAVQQGTLDEAEAFVEGIEALPAEALARGWVDVARATESLGELIEQASAEADLGLDWLAVALTAEDDGLLVTLGARTPGGADTHYEPELFDRVPADAVAALSFGGTQAVLDSIESSVDVGEISARLEDLTGISLDGLADALSGEGVLYLRAGESVPEVTLALAPPDPDETWEKLGLLAQTVSKQTATPITTVTENGVDVRRIAADEATLAFARLDEDTMIVTTGSDAIRRFGEDGDKLVGTDAFRQAADAVELGDRTKGFLYVDLDGLIPLVEGFAPEAAAQDGRDALEALDSLIFQAGGDGETTTLSGFLRVTD